MQLEIRSTASRWVGYIIAALSLSLALVPLWSREPIPIVDDERMSVQEIERMPKYDVHAHVMALGPGDREKFVAFLDRNNFRWLDICTGGLEWDLLGRKMELARSLHRNYPKRIAWAPSFNLSNWGSKDWQRDALETLKTGFSQGAVAAKVWKEIGMSLRDPDGRHVMIDDPRFGPVLDYVESQGRALVAHLGEPRNCWLPLADMTVESDRRYFSNNPRYHAYLRPEIPAYWEQIAARDRLLAKHPGLRVVGCHLGSLEFDVDEIAKRFEKYPNLAVDLAARLVHLQIQPREKVRNFLIKYQDRVLYGTDLTFGSEKGERPGNTEQALNRFEQAYRLDAAWLATETMVEVPRASASFKSRGVALPSSVLRKIYFENAGKWYGLK